MDELKELLAVDANIPPETVPTLLTELEKLQSTMRTVDNHLLIIARGMVERKQLVERKLRKERRAKAYRWTLGLVARAAKAVGRGTVATAKAVGSTTVKVVTAPVRIARQRYVASIEAPKTKTKKRTRRSKKAQQAVQAVTES